MADPFALLTSGVKFNRSRFASDIKRFQPNSKSNDVQNPGAVTHPPPQAQHAQQKKKRKRAALAQPQEEQGPGIDVFGKAKAFQQEDSGSEEDDGLEDPYDSDNADPDHIDSQSENSQLSDPEPETPDLSEDEDMSGSEEEGQQGSHRHTGHDRQQDPGDPSIDPGCPVVSTRDPQEAANVVRKHYRIKISGTDPPAPLRSWQELVAAAGEAAAATAAGAAGNSKDQAAKQAQAAEEAQHGQKAAERLVERLKEEVFAAQPTPIQRQAVPCLLGGRELLAVAPTGSGKTLAFLVPILLRLKTVSRLEGKAGDGGPLGPRALLLSPTHELAAQQARVLRLLLPGSGLKGALLTKATAVGNSFTKVDLLLANPLRVANLVAEKQLDLSQVRHLVLDEADKLFDMGFVTQIDAILAACTHPEVTRALFSATLPDKVEHLARSVLSDPLRVTVGARNTAVSSVKQRLLFVGRGESGKLLALRQLLSGGLTPPVLVFVATKERAKALHRELLYDGVRVDSINAAQSHTLRAAAVDNFRSGRTWVLIATDLIGRGMDFVGVRTVINFDVPTSTSDYIHRIGRTGRANQTGEAVTFFTEEDALLLRPIANLVKEAGGEVPDWMLQLKKVRTKDRKKRKLPDAVKSGATLDTRPKADKRKGKPWQQKKKQKQSSGQQPDRR